MSGDDKLDPPILRLVGASKTYGGVHALDGVDFDLRRGEVHALVGENGAGKSTLCKAIAGAIPLSSGQMEMGGQAVMFSRPADALRLGITMVYQETSLVPTMTVAQNLELGDEKAINGLRKLNIKAQQLLQSLGFHVDPAAVVSELGTAKRQMVEIARAVRRRASVLIFDEPTASLTPEEIRNFFDLIGDLRAKGVGIIFISHALEEALRIADRITVLRDGKRVATVGAQDVSRDELITLMVGRDLSHSQYARPTKELAVVRREKVLSVENVTMGSAVKNMSFSLYAGEVVAMAGLIGSGRTEVAKVIAGAFKRNLINGGLIHLRGKPVRYRVPRQAVNDGIVYVTEDRKVNGFFETLAIDENIYVGQLATKAGRTFLFKRSVKSRLGNAWIEKLRIVALSARARIVELSGGNQQKVVIAKALVQDPSVIIFDEPTRGVDVGAIPEIHAIIRKQAEEGRAVLVISSYLPEVLSIADRILVVRAGRIAAELDPTTATEQQIMYAAIH